MTTTRPHVLPGAPLPGLGQLELTVPEGVPLTLELASRGERVAAFLLDFLLLGLALLLLALLVGAALPSPWQESSGDGLLLALAWLLFFVTRAGWFLFWELRGRGRSPGKRWTGLTVVDAGGGPLRAESIMARNLTRELELWLPLTILLAPEALLPGVDGLLRLGAGLWVLVVGAFPAFHPEGARLGDLVAGTRVVRAPTARLKPELSQRTRAEQASTRTFTAAQLAVYGVYELQMLETALRIEEGAYDRRATLVQVARTIQKRLRWPHDEPDTRAESFLREFYAALRAHQEDGLRLGRRKEDQYDQPQAAAPPPRPGRPGRRGR